MLYVQNGVKKVVILFDIAISFLTMRPRYSPGSSVYIFPLDGPPEALYPDVVQAPCPAGHADLNLMG